MAGAVRAATHSASAPGPQTSAVVRPNSAICTPFSGTMRKAPVPVSRRKCALVEVPGTMGSDCSSSWNWNPLCAGTAPKAYTSSPLKSGRGAAIASELRLLTCPSVSTAAMR